MHNVITVALDDTFRDDLARALISKQHQEIAEEMEAESGPLEKGSCGGQTFDPPCGGCLACIFAQATAYDYDEPQWSQWRARADQLMASLRGVAEWRQRQEPKP